MSKTVKVGIWHETTDRTITHCPSYYAADYETLRVKPGDYPASVQFVGGYLIPMPYWLLIGIETTREDGALFSGFGGVNYSSSKLKVGEDVTYCLQMYVYQISGLIASGRLTLDPEWSFLAEHQPWSHECAPKDWYDPRLQ